MPMLSQPASQDSCGTAFRYRGPRSSLQGFSLVEVVIALGVRIKLLGEQMQGEDAELIATHQPAGEMSPYERLLGDALHGDQTLFASEDGIEAQWRIVQPILDDATPVHDYEQSTWGPPEASQLMDADGGWVNPAVSNPGS